MQTIAADQDMRAHGHELYRRGVRNVIRTGNHTDKHLASDCLRPEEKQALEQAGLSVALLFRQRAGAGGEIGDFSHAAAGRDAKRALHLAEELGQPPKSAITFAVAHDFRAPGDLARISAYFSSIRQAFRGRYRLGVHGSGQVCSHLRARALVDIAWLAGDPGWSGLTGFARSHEWALLDGKPAVWGGAGFWYTPCTNNPAFPDFGQFPVRPPKTAAPAFSAPAIFRVTARPGLNLRRGPGQNYEVCDTLPFGTLLYGHGRDGNWIMVDTRGDGRQDGHMHASFLEPICGALPVRYPPGASPFQIAQQELSESVRAYRGAAGNPRIYLYHSSTNHGDRDVVAWAASFVNYCVTAAGLTGTNSKSALSWHAQEWGDDVTGGPNLGDIAVLSRVCRADSRHKLPGGHIGFFLSQDDDYITLLAAGSDARIGIRRYPKNGRQGGHSFQLMSIRRPAGIAQQHLSVVQKISRDASGSAARQLAEMARNARLRPLKNS